MKPQRHLPMLAAATITLTLAAVGHASASTPPSDPVPADSPVDADAHADGSMPAGQSVDGSAEATSGEAESFCAAAVEAEAAVISEDPAVIGPAFEAVVAAAPADIAETVDAVIANAEEEGPEFVEAYGAMVEFMKANCGYAELNIAASDYAFGGLPAEVAAGPTIVTLQNIGTEVHEIALMRINDDVDLALEELLQLPDEESQTMAAIVGFSMAFPGDHSYALADLTPGRYIALCFLPEGATPDVLAQMQGPESSTPPGVELGPPHFMLGMVHEFTVA